MNYKLLVAEDVHHEREALCHSLQTNFGSSLTIFQAKDGREALDIYYKEVPHIAILNVGMPGLSGLEVAQQIRQKDLTCILFFLSDLDDFSCARQAISLRAMDYIMKPYDEAKLAETLTEAFRYIARMGTIIRDRPSFPRDQAAPPQPPVTDARLMLIREEITAFIEKHYMEELSMKNAAHAMNYSDAYFCKLFKQCFQTNFSTYLSHYRIEKAQALMKNLRISIKDVSSACGYSDPNYFTRIFKRVTGLTPTEYRLRLMENPKIP